MHDVAAIHECGQIGAMGEIPDPVDLPRLLRLGGERRGEESKGEGT